MNADIVAMIDGALDDFATSKDAMRWAPPVTLWDEPIVRDPVNPFEQLLHDGHDGYAARAIIVRAYVVGFVEFGNAIKRFVDDVTEAMKQIGEALNRSVGKPALRRAAQTDGRPKWQSPYGPKQQRKRA